MPAEHQYVRLTKRLPLTVVGPRTRWFVSLEYYGKNQNRGCVTARCLTNANSVTLVDGNHRGIEGHAYDGFLVTVGTIQWKILNAMVHAGNAEFFDPSDGLPKIPKGWDREWHRPPDRVAE